MNATRTPGMLKSILYVEDDLYVRTTAKLVLEVIGKLEVRDCSSGEEALAAAQGFQPDLILLDVMMPELDGLATLEQLRSMPHLAATPVLFVTGLTNASDMERYTDAGAIGVIPKPLAPLRLTDQLRMRGPSPGTDPEFYTAHSHFSAVCRTALEPFPILA